MPLFINSLNEVMFISVTFWIFRILLQIFLIQLGEWSTIWYLPFLRSSRHILYWLAVPSVLITVIMFSVDNNIFPTFLRKLKKFYMVMCVQQEFIFNFSYSILYRYLFSLSIAKCSKLLPVSTLTNKYSASDLLRFNVRHFIKTSSIKSKNNRVMKKVFSTKINFLVK